MQVIDDREKVVQIDDFKTVYLNSDEFKISATIKFDPLVLGDKISAGMQNDIANLNFDSEKRKKVQELIFKSVNTTLTQTSSVITRIEDRINHEYPFIT
jgi:hypothetical protein